MRQVRGVAHVHSTYSFDGRLTLRELAVFFTKHRIQFVFMSEHVESLNPEKLARFIADCNECSSNSLLLIPGIEIDDLNALFYGVNEVLSWTDPEDLARQLAAGGSVVAVSHPVKVKEDIPELTRSLVEGVEIWNSRHDGKLAPNEDVIQFWRSLRSRLERPLLPLCGIDFHSQHDFTPLVFELDCAHLDREKVIAAVRAGHYRIVRARKTVPLDFATGKLPFGYHLYSKTYRYTYKAIYAIYHAALRVDCWVPKGLKSRLRRIF